ncbi:hypothetical protein B0H17DRAFT_1204003 [Mycena rosella]|uniref:Uncharacterized protein n=1 Tax=Mycena rosella TaxID=1033263 RepID=A0AAD7GE61_MYCRO|nr:hypothetical protein B0H17DRAFT_1204003 [Mycena rosella]
MAQPHPILKRSASAATSSRHAHFPPSPSLTRTFSAYSPSSYDRSPIVVSPNTCALPARGCPGRTYYDGKPAAPTGATQRPKPPRRGHLHPRALASYREGNEDDCDEDEDDAEAERTPTRTSPYIALPVPPPIPHYPSAYQHPYQPPPPLIPDLSSESDESDGFISPPPGLAAAFHPGVGVGVGKYPTAYPYPYPSYPSYPAAPAPPYPSYPSAYPTYPAYPYAVPSHPQHPQPQPAQPPSPERPSPKRRARRASRSPRRPPADGYEEEDLDASVSHSSVSHSHYAPPAPAPAPKDKDKDRARKDKDRRREKHGDRALCRALAGVGFREGPEGCLGGF